MMGECGGPAKTGAKRGTKQGDTDELQPMSGNVPEIDKMALTEIRWAIARGMRASMAAAITEGEKVECELLLELELQQNKVRKPANFSDCINDRVAGKLIQSVQLAAEQSAVSRRGYANSMIEIILKVAGTGSEH